MVRALLEMDAGQVSDAGATWEEEILARVRAVDEGRATSVSLDEMWREMQGRFEA